MYVEGAMRVCVGTGCRATKSLTTFSELNGVSAFPFPLT